jgi:hypothetical protein
VGISINLTLISKRIIELDSFGKGVAAFQNAEKLRSNDTKNRVERNRAISKRLMPILTKRFSENTFSM